MCIQAIKSVGVKEYASELWTSIKEIDGGKILSSASELLEVNTKAVKTTVFIKNMDDFATVNAIYAEYFSEPFPARSCVEVARLPKDVLVECEVIAEA